jgi:N-acetylglucosamine-6-phosphate deacetylase
VIANGWLILDEGKITAFGTNASPAQQSRLFDGGGAYLAPGFIDLHVSGGAGADFLDASADAFLTVTD